MKLKGNRLCLGLMCRAMLPSILLMQDDYVGMNGIVGILGQLPRLAYVCTLSFRDLISKVPAHSSCSENRVPPPNPKSTEDSSHGPSAKLVKDFPFQSVIVNLLHVQVSHLV